jgi:hypothetical protein
MNSMKFALVSAVVSACTFSSLVEASATTINLGIYPDSGETVPPNAAISDEWRSIGILFSARTQYGEPGSLTPIAGGTGSDPDVRYLFFSPDIYGAVAIFTFVQPGTAEPEDVAFFEIDPDFDASSEHIDLVGFDELGEVVAQETLSGSDPDIPVAITGRFRTVEFRTFGNPGIGTLSSHIRFTLSSAVPVPRIPEGIVHLAPAVPNPFNPRTTLAFELSREMAVDLRIYDLFGRLVAVLLSNETAPEGRTEVSWQGCDRSGRRLPSGTYLCRLEAGGLVQTRRMMLMR